MALATATSLAVALLGGADAVTAGLARSGFSNVGDRSVTATGLNAVRFSLDERLFYWAEGLKRFVSHPVLGVGYGPKGVGIDIQPGYSGAKSVITLSHNSYISMLAIGGIVGFFLFASFFGTLLAAAGQSLTFNGPSRRRGQFAAIFAWLVAVCGASMLDDLLYFNRPITTVWIVGAVLLAMYEGQRRKTPINSDSVPEDPDARGLVVAGKSA
jgi:O-antigen ligase